VKADLAVQLLQTAFAQSNFDTGLVKSADVLLQMVCAVCAVLH